MKELKHVLDVPEYGKIVIEIKEHETFVGSIIHVPGPQPSCKKMMRLITRWMNQIIDPYQENDGRPLLVTLKTPESVLYSLVNPNQP